MADTEPLPGWERDQLERQTGPLPAEFGPLAAYNAERARGIVHTPEWDAIMADLQRRFNRWAELDG